MEISSLISEEPEYRDLTSMQWSGTMEAGEVPCPTSLVFTDESEKAESKTQDSQMHHLSPRSSQAEKDTGCTHAFQVPTVITCACLYQEEGPHLMVLNDASKKAESLHSGFSDTVLKTMEHQRKRRQKKPRSTLCLLGLRRQSQATHEWGFITSAIMMSFHSNTKTTG